MSLVGLDFTLTATELLCLALGAILVFAWRLMAQQSARIETDLRRSESRYSLAMEAVNDGHWDWIVDTDEFFASSRLLEIYGFPPDTVFRGREDFLARFPFHPEDESKWHAAVAEPFAGQGARFELEIRMLRHGEVRWIKLHGLRSRDASGRVVRWTGSVRDVTESKELERALRRSEERYAIAMDASGAGHWDWLIPTDEYYVSRRHLEMAGMPLDASWKGRAEYVARFPIHEDDRLRWETALAAHFAGKTEVFHIDVRLLPHGELHWIHMSGLCLRDASGTPVRWTGSMIDITESKLALEELAESEARFRGLTELSSDWYWRQDESFRFTEISSAALSLNGRTAHSPIGKTRWELPGIEPLNGTWDEHRALLGAHGTFRELEYCRPGTLGDRIYVSTSGGPIFDEQGRFRGYHGIARDITERKRIEGELRSRQELLDIAQKAARAVAFEWRIGAGEGRNPWSRDLDAMYGIPTGSYDGTFEAFRKLIHPEDGPALHMAIKRARETGDVAAEYRVAHADGSVRWLQAKGRMFFDAERQPLRVVGFMLDVTEQHRVEEEMKRLERQLARAQRLESLGTLAGGIAHDFNNILGAILGYGEMALRDAPPGSRLRRDVDNIMIAGERGRSLVDRILAFSRSGMAERVPVNVEALVREGLNMLALPANIRLESRLEAPTSAMLGDPSQVHQVLMNLATNAIHAMAAGGVLRVDLGVQSVSRLRVASIGTVEARDYVVLTVTDTGCGIATADLDRIFDPFFTMKEVGVGTGLGLSLVHGIVTELGGAIEVASTPGQGSRFAVYLPRHGDIGDQAAPHAEAVLPLGHRQRVLVVDDEQPLVEIATRTLTGLGYLPTGYTSSEGALAAFRARPGDFDALLTDERMPGLSGTELIREVRRIRGSLPIVMMSGYLSAAALEGLDGVGADAVLRKPLSARDLASSLARVLA